MSFFDANYLIYVATAIMLLAYIVRDELKLRSLIIMGSITYNLYYWLAPELPLWDAMFSSFLFISVNLYVLSQILLERTTFRMSEDEKRLFDAFDTLSPGQFRKVLKLARWHNVENADGAILTQQGTEAQALFFTFKEAVFVSKSEQRFRLPPGNFVGEVAFVLDGIATATTKAPLGATYLSWDKDSLKDLGEKNPPLGNALTVLLSRDLAQKLTESYRPDDALEG